MNIGIDYYKTITNDPKLFTKLINSLLIDHQIYIITAVKVENIATVRHDIRKIPCTHLEIVIFENYEDIPRLKLEACKRLGIKMMFDDMVEVCELLTKHRILTAQIR